MYTAKRWCSRGRVFCEQELQLLVFSWGGGGLSRLDVGSVEGVEPSSRSSGEI